MPRKKGSKNKPKGVIETIKDAYKEAVNEAVSEAVSEVAEETKDWKPTPDMGHIKPPAPELKHCGGCHHLSADHYGPHKRWCNVRGCTCQDFAG